MKKSLIVISILTSLYSCNKNEPKGIKGQILKSCDGKSECVVRIKDIAKFEWTKMYVFRYNATRANIEKALGISYPYYIEFTDRIVFLKGINIVYHEENKTNLEGINKGDVIFDFIDTTNYTSYTPDDANFILNKVDGSSGIYYELLKFPH